MRWVLRTHQQVFEFPLAIQSTILFASLSPHSLEHLSMFELTLPSNWLYDVGIAMSGCLLNWIIFPIVMAWSPYSWSFATKYNCKDSDLLRPAWFNCYIVSLEKKIDGKTITYTEHEWLPSVAGFWHPLVHSLGCPTSPGFLQWNSTFLRSSFSRSDPFKASFRSASVNPIVSSISLMQRCLDGK